MPATPTEKLEHLAIAADELASTGALWTAREIEQQPHMLQRTHALLAKLHADLQKFVAPVADDPLARVKLFQNLSAVPAPISLLSQHLPHALHAVREGAATRDPLSLAMAHVGAVLDDYHHACHTH